MTVHRMGWDELDKTILYLLLKLRSDVFVVEQRDPYPELDGRDLEPGTVHLWFAHRGVPVAYLRILQEQGNAVRIGRVVVAPNARGAGLGDALMTEALKEVGHRRCVLNAQAHQVGFYARFGFSEAGIRSASGVIPHVPMERLPRLGE